MAISPPSPSPSGAAPGSTGGSTGFGPAGASKRSHVPRDLSDEPFLRDAPRTNFEGIQVPSLAGIPLLARLGRGGMGAVFWGIHPRLHREVAVKVLLYPLLAEQPDLVQRFLREAQLAAQVQSPHLVAVLDVNEEAKLFYLVMEYVHGLTAGGWARQVKKENRAAPEADALDLCIAATEGLAVAHRKGIVHRDIKPENILVPYADDGRTLDFPAAKLSDLGLARAEGVGQSLTGTQAALGTPGFMAPEQGLDAHKAGKPADIFSMGASLYALLAGQAPFRGSNAMQAILHTMQQPHEPLARSRPDVSPQTCALLERCLAKDPSQRFADAAALQAALIACRMALSDPASSLALSHVSLPPTVQAPTPHAPPASQTVPASPSAPAATPVPPSSWPATAPLAAPSTLSAAPPARSGGLAVALLFLLPIAGLGAGGFYWWQQQMAEARALEALRLEARTWWEEGQREAQAGRGDGALEAWRRLSARHAESPWGQQAAERLARYEQLLQQGRGAFEQGQDREALQALEEAAQVARTADARVLTFRARARMLESRQHRGAEAGDHEEQLAVLAEQRRLLQEAESENLAARISELPVAEALDSFERDLRRQADWRRSSAKARIELAAAEQTALDDPALLTPRYEAARQAWQAALSFTAGKEDRLEALKGVAAADEGLARAAALKNYRRLLDAGAAQAREGAWEEARKAYEAAAETAGDHRLPDLAPNLRADAARLAARCETARDVAALEGQARERERAGDLEQADARLKEALERGSGKPAGEALDAARLRKLKDEQARVAGLIAQNQNRQLAEKRYQEALNRAKKAEAAKDWDEALRQYRAAQAASNRPELAEPVAQAQRMVERIAKLNESLAAALRGQDWKGAQGLYHELAGLDGPRRTEHLQAAQKMQEQLLQKFRKEVDEYLNKEVLAGRENQAYNYILTQWRDNQNDLFLSTKKLELERLIRATYLHAEVTRAYGDLPAVFATVLASDTAQVVAGMNKTAEQTREAMDQNSTLVRRSFVSRDMETIDAEYKRMREEVVPTITKSFRETARQLRKFGEGATMAATSCESMAERLDGLVK
ncbi:MAG: protein kinase [Planctomycetota bacterium]|nr:protein kinase [Planctomycetota bacterium]